MADNWDDSDDDWDKSDDELDKRLGLANINDSKNEAPVFDDEEEDLTVKEKEAAEKASKVSLKAKGSALAKKKVSSFVIRFFIIHTNANIFFFNGVTNRIKSQQCTERRHWKKLEKKN